MATASALAQLCSVRAEIPEVYSIADQIKAETDCSDPSNAECKTLFESTCTWAGETSITLRDGIAQGIPFDRIGERIIGEAAVGRLGDENVSEACEWPVLDDEANESKRRVGR